MQFISRRSLAKPGVLVPLLPFPPRLCGRVFVFKIAGLGSKYPGDPPLDGVVYDSEGHDQEEIPHVVRVNARKLDGKNQAQNVNVRAPRLLAAVLLQVQNA